MTPVVQAPRETASALLGVHTLSDRATLYTFSSASQAQALYLADMQLCEQLMGHTKNAVELSRILVTEAVAMGPEEPGQEITVGVAAERLAIDLPLPAALLQRR